jgi:hypothetical protein
MVRGLHHLAKLQATNRFIAGEMKYAPGRVGGFHCFEEKQKSLCSRGCGEWCAEFILEEFDGLASLHGLAEGGVGSFPLGGGFSAKEQREPGNNSACF